MQCYLITKLNFNYYSRKITKIKKQYALLMILYPLKIKFAVAAAYYIFNFKGSSSLHVSQSSSINLKIIYAFKIYSKISNIHLI